MQDIEKLALECGFEKHPINGYLVVRHSNGSWVNVKPKLEAFAKTLQGDVEPVAWMVKDVGLVSFGLITDTPPKIKGIIKDATLYKLYTSPPNTQAKLDKAIEALERIVEAQKSFDSKVILYTVGMAEVAEKALIAIKGE